MASAEWTPIARVYDPLKAGSIDMTDEDPHDRAIIRALNSKYKPNRDVKGDPKCTIFVARLNPKTVEETLESEFSYFGEIRNIRLIKDIVTGFSRCYAFVEYKEERSAQRAQRDGARLEIDGHEVFVDNECERTMPGWIPRRLGGGFGGKKESGQLRFGGKDRPWRKPILMQNKRDYDEFQSREDYDIDEQRQRKRYDHSERGSQRERDRRGSDRDRERYRHRDDDRRDRYRRRSRDRY